MIVCFMLKYYILITSDNSTSKHERKMEQYAGDGTDLESLPTMIIKIALIIIITKNDLILNSTPENRL